MGIVGKYIDALSDEQRDKIVEAKDMHAGKWGWWDGGCGCLVATAEMTVGEYETPPVTVRVSPKVPDYYATRDWRAFCPQHAFPRLCERFGKDRIVRLCKERAAKGNAPNIRAIRDGIYVERKDTVEREGSSIPAGGKIGRFPLDSGFTR